jgi:four helix bundle protein
LSYKNLDIWKLARELVVDIHKMSLEQLSKHEMFETGSQIRRSVKSVKSNIVEGYGRRYYKQEFIRFIIYALASNDETIDHLETLVETGSLKNKDLFENINKRLKMLGKKLNRFLSTVKKEHKTNHRQ